MPYQKGRNLVGISFYIHDLSRRDLMDRQVTALCAYHPSGNAKDVGWDRDDQTPDNTPRATASMADVLQRTKKVVGTGQIVLRLVFTDEKQRRIPLALMILITLTCL